VKIGMQFFVTSHTIDPATLARATEAAGFESFWLPEHAILPADTATKYPMTGGRIPDVYGQMPDPFVLLGFLAAATTTLKIGMGVCIVPEHHPLILAKLVSTADCFSGGRLLLGIGVGWMREEIELFGTDFDTRWKFTRESVEAMRALWKDGVAGYDGDLVRFPPVICEPMPVQRPGPPVIIGGQPSDRTFRRIATWGDGWIIMSVTPDDVAAGRKAITIECEKLGRDPSGIEITVGVSDASPEVQRAFADAGADRLVVSLYNHPGGRVPADKFREIRQEALTSNAIPSAEETLRVLHEVAELAGLSRPQPGGDGS
jgi:probable F420-dependent oxidoreductase